VFYVTNTFFLKKIPISLTIIHFSWLSFFAGILIFHCMARKLKWFETCKSYIVLHKKKYEMTSTGKISLKLKSKTAQENEELKKRIEQLEMENADLKSRLADETTSREWLENRVSELTSKNQNLEKRIVELLSEQQSKTCEVSDSDSEAWPEKPFSEAWMAKLNKRCGVSPRKSDDESERPPECKVQ
jgi:preprotein translocase subunit SecF